MENLVITQNFLNVLNHLNCGVERNDATDEPTTFSNAASADGGRNLIIPGVTGTWTQGTYHSYTFDHIAGTDQKLIRFADGGLFHTGSSAYTKIYSADLTVWQNDQYFLGLNPLSVFSPLLDADTAGATMIGYTDSSVSSQMQRTKIMVGLIQGSSNVWNAQSTDYTGKMLCANQGRVTFVSVLHAGAHRVKVNIPVDVTNFSSINSIVFSIASGNFSQGYGNHYWARPILAGVNLSSAVPVENGDRIQVTLDFSATFS